MENEIKKIAQTLAGLLQSEKTETGPFDFAGGEFHGTKVRSSTGTAVLVHEPMNGDWTTALLIPEENFEDIGTVVYALEMFKVSITGGK